jgi:hypothetical protein
MSMLGPYFRFVIENRTGQTFTVQSAIKVRFKPWKFDSNGQVTWNNSFVMAISNGILPSSSNANVSNLGFLGSYTFENIVDKWVGATIEMDITAPASSNGDVILYLDRSIDGGIIFSDNGLSQNLGSLNFTASGTKKLTINL